jgi:hypothetical protein
MALRDRCRCGEFLEPVPVRAAALLPALDPHIVSMPDEVIATEASIRGTPAHPKMKLKHRQRSESLNR